ncbi:amidase family protein [Paenibacillus soyae]|uniref:Amidase family protein n=1 Tax=Paenibacillus soyae TaxID=2969249 RepID=A0A9X2MUL5_9BACL|nr:amidase family protein [Paenibacillus soyae]MCR2806564.1 amidase family protein [Paenibacillus soyae]
MSLTISKPLHEWIAEADIHTLQSAMEAGLVSSEELVQAYMERIERWNPRINAILELNPDAENIARELDAERLGRGSRGPLHGIPILLKDNIDTHDRMHTSAGSVALAHSIAPEDSFVAKKLREAGAVLLGKTNMTEWSNFMSWNMPAGYSSRGGQVFNPYGPGEVFVNGSSSGSAAAAAASLAAAAIGTETAGSIVGPASQHALVGIKPTVGLVSRSGVIPISSNQDTAGPLARTVADAAILLGALTGVDERDSRTRESSGLFHRDYTPFLDETFLPGARIGIPRAFYEHLDEERLAIMEGAIAALRNEGATIVDDLPLPVSTDNWNGNIVGYEFKRGIDRYLSLLGPSASVHSLEELIAFNEAHAEHALRYGQNVLTDSQAVDMTEEEYEREQAAYKEKARREGIDYLIRHYRLDALLLPGDADGKYMAARMGYPLICVPAGYSERGIIDSDGDPTKGPFGVIFSGGAYSEPTLIKLAYGFEQATRHRVPPPAIDSE